MVKINRIIGSFVATLPAFHITRGYYGIALDRIHKDSLLLVAQFCSGPQVDTGADHITHLPAAARLSSRQTKHLAHGQAAVALRD